MYRLIFIELTASLSTCIILTFITGAEVAQYCATNLPSFLKESRLYKEGKYIEALEEAYLGFDALLTTPEVIKELKVLAGVESDDEHEGLFSFYTSIISYDCIHCKTAAIKLHPKIVMSIPCAELFVYYYFLYILVRYILFL